MKALPQHRALFGALGQTAAMDNSIRRRTVPTVDRVTCLRLWAEAENISKDAMEAAIEFVRHDAPSLSDLQIHNLATIINRKFWLALEKGVKLGCDLGPAVSEHCGQDIGDEVRA
jgi:hypothetical protein